MKNLKLEVGLVVVVDKKEEKHYEEHFNYWNCFSLWFVDWLY